MLNAVSYNGLRVRFVPTSLYCWTVGYNIINGRKQWRDLELSDMDEVEV
ncbi:MAG: hypothetical protein AB7F88_07920 [Pyrinomonadaceae bacterium]